MVIRDDYRIVVMFGVAGRAVSAPTSRPAHINLDDALKTIRGSSQQQQYNVGDSGTVFLQVSTIKQVCILTNEPIFGLDCGIIFLYNKTY